MPLSAVLITMNEAADLERCLRALHFVQEIVVLDSGSTDGTVELARRLGARVIETDWPGFGIQKNRAVAAATHDWVLSLDADEWCDQTLAASIVQAMARAACDPRAPRAYRFRRLNLYRGQAMRHGDWGRDRPLRLFHRDAGRFSEVPVHESVQTREPVEQLPGLLWHDSIADYAEARAKYDRYARLSAQTLARQGRGGWLRASVSALFAFLRSYLLRAGWLDGGGGLQLAWLGARYTFFKYYLARSQS